MKNMQIFSDVVSQLNKLNVPYTVNQGTDVTISCEFLDAGWSAGSKKIKYEASVHFDEENKTILMWELTTEKSSGFSFGSENDSSFQSGITLFRKVKSIQYGLDGKAYEYTLDLGAIPKAVKETAKAYGWRFKTVLRKDKAVQTNAPAPSANPSFYVQSSSEKQPPIQIKQTNSAAKAAAHGKTTGILLGIACIIIVIFFIFIFSDNSTSVQNGIIMQGGQENSSAADTNSENAGQAPQQASPSEDTKPVLDMGSHFDNILKKVKQEWKDDAKISKIYTSFLSDNFHELNPFNPEQNWNVKFFSPSSNAEITTILRYEWKDSEGIPAVVYFCESDSGEKLDLTGSELKKNTGIHIIEEQPAAAYKEEYDKMPDNMLSGAAMTYKAIADAAYNEIKNEKNESGSYGVSIYYVDQMIVGGDEVNSAVWEVSWSSGDKRKHFVISPFSGKKYEY